jgi:RimJ/RimL family protein N-acetyltransferase
MPTGPFTDVGAFAEHVAKLCATPAMVPMAILLPDGTPVGIATFLRIDHANGTAEVGYISYSAALQRTTAATEAMYLMAAHAFDVVGVRRYEWKCDALNAASRSAAARLGFTYEGTFRQAVVTKGRNRDTAWFAITDGEWPRLRAAFDAWLDPANFDEQGRQRARLQDLPRA